jgi:hypothetical protein
MPKITRKQRIEIKLTEIMQKFGIEGKVTKFTVPTRHNCKTDEEWHEKIYLIIETEKNGKSS